MILTKAVKSTALATLKGKWFFSTMVSFTPVFTTVIFVLLSGILQTFFGFWSNIVAFLLYVSFVMPLWLGTIRTFWRMLNGCDDSIASVFYYYGSIKSFIRAFKFVWYITLLLSLNVAIIFLPAIASYLITSGHIFEFFNTEIPIFVLNFKFITIILFIVATIISVIRIMNYYLAAFCFVSMDELSSVKSVLQSVKIAKYTKNFFVTHILGYLGWLLISAFMIPLVFTAPYLLVSYAVDCRYSVAYYNRVGIKEDFQTYNV